MRKHSLCVCAEKQFKVRHLPSNRLRLDIKCQFSPVSLKKCKDPKHKFLRSSINHVFYFQVLLVLKTDLPSPLGKKQNKTKQNPRTFLWRLKKPVFYGKKKVMGNAYYF